MWCNARKNHELAGTDEVISGEAIAPDHSVCKAHSFPQLLYDAMCTKDIGSDDFDLGICQQQRSVSSRMSFIHYKIQNKMDL
jgi:hypothetical protein